MRTEVVVNANAAAFAADPRQIAAVQRAAAGARRVVVTHDLGELERAAAEMKTAGVDRVVLCGGDGTFMAGLSALVASGVDPLPEICLAPGGTVATVARNLGQKQGLLAAVRRAADPSGDVTLVTHPTLRVSEVGGRTRIGFIFGTGLVARFFQRYYATGAGGYAGAAKIVARVFVGSFVSDSYSRSVLDPLPCTLELAINNEVDRFSLAIDVVDRVPRLRVAGAHAKERFRNQQIACRRHAHEHGIDAPEASAWQWPF